uniref:J domain-containing protein n=1 Tax=Neobodo designis TaxID=312471 RepID=A0A7S1L3B4_NEODS|mmetsp:Transcript_14017/g.43651  ORF Transcript_14017/g.43651 Transcript_14017/m.43651 type:complete len:319 (+) Transcript_14017:113-1069(+)
MQGSDVIRRVMASKDHYVTLGVSKQATADEISKAYKKLSLLLHPDKCTHPEAADAFKKVSQAKTVLSNPSLREAYVRYGDAGVQARESGNDPAAAAAAERQRQRYGGGGGGGAHYMNEADLFEELFGSLFGATPRQRAYQQQQRRQQQYQQQQYQQRRQPGQQQQGGGDVNLGFFMIVPLLLFIAMNFALSMGGNNSSSFGGGASDSWGGRRGGVEDTFTLSRDPRRGFTVARHVEQVPEVDDVRVNYFVKGDFNEMLRRRRLSTRSVELHVVRLARDSLGRRCRAELQSWQQLPTRSVTNRPQVCKDYDKLRHVPHV